MERWLHLGVALAAITACRPGPGERCFCQGECRTGLVCAAGGAVLREGECVRDNVEAGSCIDGENANADNEDFDQPVYLDLGVDRETDPPVTTSPDDDPMTSSGSTTASMSTTTDTTGTTAAPTTTSTSTGATDTDPSSTGSSSTAL